MPYSLPTVKNDKCTYSQYTYPRSYKETSNDLKRSLLALVCKKKILFRAWKYIMKSISSISFWLFFCNLLWVNIRAHIFSVSAGEVSSKGYIKSLPGAEDVNLLWQICNKYTIENIYIYICAIFEMKIGKSFVFNIFQDTIMSKWRT